ncbi:MAG: hypothetical protein WCJ30_20180 [Deltaproteobacteria bacterium]
MTRCVNQRAGVAKGLARRAGGATVPAVMEATTATVDAPHEAAQRRIESLERENADLQKRLETLGSDNAALRANRSIASGERLRGSVVVFGLSSLILAVFAAALVMYMQIGKQRARETVVDLPNTPRGTGMLGFPPPPPDMGNPGTTRVPAH